MQLHHSLLGSALVAGQASFGTLLLRRGRAPKLSSSGQGQLSSNLDLLCTGVRMSQEWTKSEQKLILWGWGDHLGELPRGFDLKESPYVLPKKLFFFKIPRDIICIQVQLRSQASIESVAVTINSDGFQHFTIFVIELLHGNKALYKPCSKFEVI